MSLIGKLKNMHSGALFGLAFRPFFLAAALFSLLLMLTWLALFSGWLSFAPYGGATFWHSHEMLFGFVGAVLAGFLLTAVQNWTGIRAAHGKPLLMLLLIWLAGRLLMAFPLLPASFILAVDLMFLPLAALFVFVPLLARQQTRNYFAVLALFLLMLCNGISHYGVITDSPALQQQAFFCATLLITLMMAIIGGRIIPMFTSNTTQIAPRPRQNWLDNAGLAALWSIFALTLIGLDWQAPDWLFSLLFALAAILLAIRSSRWRFFSTLAYPLLWSLHIGYWWLIAGLAAFAAHYAGLDLSYNTALHCLTAGAMGMLILSMMSRVALGHTARPIEASPLVTASLLLVLLAALVRVLGANLPLENNLFALQLSGGLWSLAFLLFFISYLPILSKPRRDGQPG